MPLPLPFPQVLKFEQRRCDLHRRLVPLRLLLLLLLLLLVVVVVLLLLLLPFQRPAWKTSSRQ